MTRRRFHHYASRLQRAPDTIVLRLSWPASELSPNARLSRREAARAMKAARHEALAEAKRLQVHIAPDAHIELAFFPPDQRRRDLGNLLIAMKPALKGLGEAAGVDDCGWAFTIRRGVAVDGGCVVVTITNHRE